MPRDTVRTFTYTDPLADQRESMRREAERRSGESVISPYHPANEHRPSHNSDNRDYTFRQRNATKLSLTLGWELEANRVANKVPNGVEQIGDGSVNGDGAEYVVMPAVTKSPRYVLGLLKDLVHAPNLNTDESTGFHVHVSASNVTLPRMRQWALATEHLAMMIEDLAFKAVPDSRKDNQYCRRIRPLTSGHRFVSSKYSNDRRYHWLNTVEMFRPNGIRTIENRLLGHTHRWKYVLSWALFTMELATHGWELAHKPFTVNDHVSPLESLLKAIMTEIKPLDKRHEPIPQWVYAGLKRHGIEPNAWERPLARLTEIEYDLKGYSKPFYSDNQPEIPNREREDDDYCPCGCDTEGRCDSQMHSDGDCESNYCDYCHEDGNCSGSPRCERCRENRHDEGEDCENIRCSTCHPTPRVTVRPVAVNPLPSVGSTVTFTRPVTGSSNVTIHPSNEIESRLGYSAIVHPDTFNTMQAEVNSLHNMTVDNEALRINQIVTARAYDAGLYGQSIAHICYDESVNVGTNVHLSIEAEDRIRNLNSQAYDMLDLHEEALSVDRNYRQGGR